MIRKVTPGWAETYGKVERFMQTVKKSARVAKIEGRAFRQALHTVAEPAVRVAVKI